MAVQNKRTLSIDTKPTTHRSFVLISMEFVAYLFIILSYWILIFNHRTSLLNAKEWTYARKYWRKKQKEREREREFKNLKAGEKREKLRINK